MQAHINLIETKHTSRAEPHYKLYQINKIEKEKKNNDLRVICDIKTYI